MNYQRRLAARVFKVGVGRIYFDPSKMDEISKAITADDIRSLAEKGYIKILPKVGNSRGRWRAKRKQVLKGRRKGHGSRKGKKGAREGKKREWIRKIRAQRRYLKEIKERLKEGAFKDLYRKASGGFFRSVAHLKLYIEKNNLMRGSE